MTEDETVGWYHRLNGLEFEHTPRDGEGQSMGSQRVRHDLATKQQQCPWSSHVLLLLLLLLLSHFSHIRLCVTPETTARQAPPSLGFSRQEHWSRLPFPSPIHESEK